jgi:hypothetical protein
MAVTGALGAGAAFGVAACGDDEREGTVEIQGGTTGTGTVGTIGTVGTTTAPETTPTAPETTPTSP